MPLAKTRVRPSVRDKLKVIADSNVRLAAGESLKSICRLHNIQPQQLRTWRRNVAKLSRAKKSLKSLHKGFRGRLHNHEEELVAWVLEMREQGVRLCYKHIIIQAIHIDPAFGELPFDVQYGAVRRLCIRNSITICRVAEATNADKDLYNDGSDVEDDDEFEADFEQYILV